MDRRRSREIASLRVLEESAVKCPRIFRYGDLEDGSEWLITEYIEGETLDLVSTNISEANKIKIFEEIGEELGKLHSFKSFDFFGEWDENGQSVHNITDFYNYFIDSTETAIRRVVNQDLPHGIMLKRAIDKIRSNYALFNNPFISKLLHNDFDGRNILVKQYDGEYKLS
jgi:aminoglycoside phosphotransferase (APT) family kinase protein